MMVPRDWFAELLDRWRTEIRSEPFRHAAELREAIRRRLAQPQVNAEAERLLDRTEPPDDRHSA
jgi:hypothetical protein